MEKKLAAMEEEQTQSKKRQREMEEEMCSFKRQVTLIDDLQQQVAFLNKMLLISMTEAAAARSTLQDKPYTSDRVCEYVEELSYKQCCTIEGVTFIVNKIKSGALTAEEIKYFLHLLAFALDVAPEQAGEILKAWKTQGRSFRNKCWMEWDLRHTNASDQLWEAFIEDDCDGDVKWDHDASLLFLLDLCTMDDNTGKRCIEKISRSRKQSLLHVFAIFGYDEAAKLILKFMTSDTRQAHDADGQTAAHYAASESYSPHGWHSNAKMTVVFTSHPGVMVKDFGLLNKENRLPLHELAINYNLPSMIICLTNCAICCHNEQDSFADKVQTQWKNKNGDLLVAVLKRMLVNCEAPGDRKAGVEDLTNTVAVNSDFCNLDVLRKLIKLFVGNLEKTVKVVENLAALFLEHVEASEHEVGVVLIEMHARWLKWVSERSDDTS